MLDVAPAAKLNVVFALSATAPPGAVTSTVNALPDTGSTVVVTTDTCWSPLAPVSSLSAIVDGVNTSVTFDCAGVTASDSAAAPSPAAFTARNSNVYAAPLIRPVTVWLTAHSEGGAAVLEFVAKSGDSNIEDRIAVLGDSSPGHPVDREVSLRLLRHLASEVRHRQYHDIDLVTVRVERPESAPEG